MAVASAGHVQVCTSLQTDNHTSTSPLSLTSAGRTSVDIGASAKLELVDKFCHLGDMMSVDGDADATVEARIRIGISSGSWYHCLPIRTCL